MNLLPAPLRRYIPPSIRLQLACWYTIAFAALLLCTGYFFYSYLEGSLEKGVDSALQIRAQQIASGIQVKNGNIIFHNVTGDLPGFGAKASDLPSDVNDDALVRLLDAHGTIVGETPAFRALPVPTSSISQPLQGHSWQSTIISPTSEEIRIYSRALIYHGRAVAVVQVGESLDSLHNLLHKLVSALLLTGAGVLLVCAFGSYWMAARSFAPIQQLAATARRIKAGDLHQRVPISPAHDEIQYLALTLNEMLDSLEQSFSRQRRFVADASHELRTPVAVIRSKADIALLEETLTLSEATTVLQEIRDETQRLSHLISDLLALAHGDEGKAHFDREPVQLDILAETVAAATEVLANEHGVQLSVQIREPVTLEGDEARLIQVVMNLLDNAIRYTNPGGIVTVTVEKTSSAAMLTVRDTGIGIAPEHLPHIFERFYRADSARVRTGGSSSGLGLAIVAWIVNAHGGSIDVASQVGHGSCFKVSLPFRSTKYLLSPTF